MTTIVHGLYFSLDELVSVASTLCTGTATTAVLAAACKWQRAAAWGEVKEMENRNYIEKLDKPPFQDTSLVRWSIKAGNALTAKIEHEMAIVKANLCAEPKFIRCGKWCRCLRSQIGDGPCFEVGVSTYTGRRTGSAWQPTERAFWRKNIATVNSGSPWYLVTGAVMKIGSDGEPVLKSPCAVATLEWDAALGSFCELEVETPQHPRSDHPACVRKQSRPANLRNPGLTMSKAASGRQPMQSQLPSPPAREPS